MHNKHTWLVAIARRLPAWTVKFRLFEVTTIRIGNDIYTAVIVNDIVIARKYEYSAWFSY